MGEKLALSREEQIQHANRLLADTAKVVLFFGNQPFAQIPQVVALGDIAINLQDVTSPVAQYQVPAVPEFNALIQQLLVEYRPNDYKNECE